MQQRIYKVGTIKKDRVYILTLFLTNFFHYLVVLCMSMYGFWYARTIKKNPHNAI